MGRLALQKLEWKADDTRAAARGERARSVSVGRAEGSRVGSIVRLADVKIEYAVPSF